MVLLPSCRSSRFQDWEKCNFAFSYWRRTRQFLKSLGSFATSSWGKSNSCPNEPFKFFNIRSERINFSADWLHCCVYSTQVSTHNNWWIASTTQAAKEAWKCVILVHWSVFCDCCTISNQDPLLILLRNAGLRWAEISSKSIQLLDLRRARPRCNQIEEFNAGRLKIFINISNASFAQRLLHRIDNACWFPAPSFPPKIRFTRQSSWE